MEIVFVAIVLVVGLVAWCHLGGISVYSYNLSKDRLEQRTTDRDFIPCSEQVQEEFFKHIRGNERYTKVKSRKDPFGDYRVDVDFSTTRWLSKRDKVIRLEQKEELENQFRSKVSRVG